MRISVKVRDLKVGQIAFLPCFGGLRKAQITRMSAPHLANDGLTYVIVDYNFLSVIPAEASCIMNVDNEYPIYVRPVRARHPGKSLSPPQR